MYRENNSHTYNLVWDFEIIILYKNNTHIVCEIILLITTPSNKIHFINVLKNCSL